MAQTVYFKLPPPVCRAMEQLKSAGYEAYIVGGCVRDMLMNRNPHDFDIATSALPEEILHVFSREKVVLTGFKHGTVSVLLDGMYLEITTFRIDGNYIDGRHPEAVSFTPKLEADLSRRDFTINALAYSPDTGILDFCGGQQDLSDGRIRTVGDPAQRFSEDALRILRAYRFASVLDFTIEEITQETAAQMFSEIKKISAERITAEFIRLLEGSAAGKILAQSPELFGIILNVSRITPDFCTVCRQVVDGLPFVFRQRFAALNLLYLIMIKEVPPVSLLRTDRKTGAFIKDVIALATAFPIPGDYSGKCLLQKYGAHCLTEMLQVLLIVSQNTDSKLLLESEVSKTIQIAQKLMDLGVCYSLNQLAVNGRDVMEIKGCQGREIGRILTTLLDEVMLGKLPNDREILLSKIIDT